MLKCWQGNYLLTNAHLIIDEKREYLNGALAICDGIISALLVQSEHLYADFKDYQKIDVRGHIIQSGFVHPLLIDISFNLALLHENLLKKGITSYLGVVKDYETFLLAEKDSFCLGYYCTNYIPPFKTSKFLANISSNIIVRAKQKIATLNYSSSADLLEILNDEESLKFVCLNDFLYLNTLKKASSRYKIIAYPQNSYSSLKALNTYNYRDKAAITSLNILRFFNLDLSQGSLVRGKKADLVCYNKDYKILFTIKGGKIYL